MGYLQDLEKRMQAHDAERAASEPPVFHHVVPHDPHGGGWYKRANVVKTFKSPKLAQKHAEKLNASGGNFVVRSSKSVRECLEEGSYRPDPDYATSINHHMRVGADHAMMARHAEPAHKAYHEMASKAHYSTAKALPTPKGLRPLGDKEPGLPGKARLQHRHAAKLATGLGYHSLAGEHSKFGKLKISHQEGIEEVIDPKAHAAAIKHAGSGHVESLDEGGYSDKPFAHHRGVPGWEIHSRQASTHAKSLSKSANDVASHAAAYHAHVAAIHAAGVNDSRARTHRKAAVFHGVKAGLGDDFSLKMKHREGTRHTESWQERLYHVT